MNHLKSLTKKLHALLPELTKIEFGTRVLHSIIGLEDDQFVASMIVNFELKPQKDHSVLRGYNTYSVGSDGGNLASWLPESEIVGVLGKEVTLEHVLKALDVIARAEYLQMSMDCGHPTLLLSYMMTSGMRRSEWQLGLPLDQQSPETIEFLDNLIPDPTSK